MQNSVSHDDFRRIIKFEIASVLGRTFKRNKSKIRTDKTPFLLDLGVGNNFTEGWIHADFYSFKLKFWKNNFKNRKPEIELDLRYPLRCETNVVDGVFCSHTIEHLNRKEATNLLNEIYRILKPSCFLRVIVPDVEKAVKFYLGENKEFAGFETGCEAISDITQNWGHKSAWDATFLSMTLKNVGFKNVRKVEFGIEGSDKRLIKETEDRRRDSLVVEAQKA